MNMKRVLVLSVLSAQFLLPSFSLAASNEINGKGFWHAIRRNIGHTAPLAFYSVLGASTQTHIPYVGTLPLAVPAAFFAANVWARFDETGKLIEDRSAQLRHQNSIIAEYMVNIGLSSVSALAVAYASGVALPVIGGAIAMNFISAGEESPIEYLKEYTASALDNIRGVAKR